MPGASRNVAWYEGARGEVSDFGYAEVGLPAGGSSATLRADQRGIGPVSTRRMVLRPVALRPI